MIEQLGSTKNYTKIFLHVLGFVLCILLTISLPAIISAQAAAVIRPNPNPINIEIDKTGNLDILIESVQNLYGVEFNAHFDPAIVQVVDADLVQDGVQMIPGSMPSPDWVVRNTVDNQNGTLQYVVIQVNPTLPADGSGTFLTIPFQGITLTQSSPFVIDRVLFSDRFGVAIPVTPQNGVIKVLKIALFTEFKYYLPFIKR